MPRGMTCEHGVCPKSSCKQCSRDKFRAWAAANPEKRREYSRARARDRVSKM